MTHQRTRSVFSSTAIYIRSIDSPDPENASWLNSTLEHVFLISFIFCLLFTPLLQTLFPSSMLTVDRDHWPTLLDRALHSSAYAIIHQYRRSGDHRGEAAKKEPGPHGDPARTVRTTGYPTNGGASTTDGEAFLAARRDPPGGCRIGPPVVHAGIAHRRPSARPQSIVSHRQEVAGKRQLGTQVAITPYMSSMCV